MFKFIAKSDIHVKLVPVQTLLKITRLASTKSCLVITVPHFTVDHK